MEDAKKYQALLRYYREKIIMAKCSHVKIAKAVDELIEFMTEALTPKNLIIPPEPTPPAREEKQ